ncbi:MAG: hypothetical protein ABR525_08760 [Candidatus Limnocylindria bacterium]
MLPLGGIFAFVGRQLGRIMTLAFSWATTALFGRVPKDKQLLLSAMAGASLLWPIVLVSIAFPSVATFLLAFVKLPAWAEGYVRPVMIVLAILLPLAVGGLSARIQAPSPKGLALLPALLRGFPYALGLFLVLVWMLFLAPVSKIGAIVRRWQDAHVPISIQPGGYDTVVRDLGDALGRAQLSVQPVPAGWAYAMPGRILALFAGKRVGALVPENVVRLAGTGFEVTVHPMDLALRGAKVPLGRARAAITSELAFTAAHQTWTKRAQELEDELAAASESGVDLDALGEKIVHADLEHDEWDILYRVFLQVQVRRNAGGEKTPGAPRQPSLGARVVRLVTTLPRQLRGHPDNAVLQRSPATGLASGEEQERVEAGGGDGPEAT